MFALGFPEFDSMGFPLTFLLYKPAPYDGSDLLVEGFLLQSQLYLQNLLDPQPSETQKVLFMMSRLRGAAREWARQLWSERGAALVSVKEFEGLMRAKFSGKNPFELGMGKLVKPPVPIGDAPRSRVPTAANARHPVPAGEPKFSPVPTADVVRVPVPAHIARDRPKFLLGATQDSLYSPVPRTDPKGSRGPFTQITCGSTMLNQRNMFLYSTFVLMHLVGRYFAAAALPQTAAPILDGKPFVVIWNSPISKCQQLKISLDLTVFQAVTTPAKIQNQTLTLFYKKRLGLFPYIELQTLTQHSGAIPQKGNLTASLQKAKEEFTQYVNPSVPGLAVLDWEEWFPLFDQNADLRAIYKDLSINYTLQLEPSLTHKQATIKANKQFEKAARSFMEETLKLGISERPQNLWGYYLFPDCYNYAFENPSYTGRCSQNATQLNTELFWLWDTSTALFPSAYMPSSISGSQKAALFVRNQVLEAMRVAALPKHPYTAPIYLYLRLLLREQKQYMQQADLVRSIGESAALGAAGCVLWGSSYDFNDKASCTSLSTYLSETLNQYIVNVTTAAQLCSEFLCQGNGRCVRKDYDSNDYLYLSLNSFNIQKSGGLYNVTGKPSVSDLSAWNNKFTCQCYEGRICPVQIPLLGCSKRHHGVIVYLSVLLAVFLSLELS
ncbi:hyaluronidase-1-like [Trichomycterus rosablanca]|uniref:hyaluronidase-1-like n=1 Tax=Trichomycterus rosablanca TaxID=2290929 RepID=UPI002F35EE11